MPRPYRVITITHRLRFHRRACVRLAAAAALVAAGTGGALGATRDLADLSLEQLAQVVVTSVSGHEQPLAAAAASIYVITNDDIRRAAVTTLPEALRLAPNLQVARVNAGQYAITARGSNNAIGNKLLVLVDGRSIYAPFFSGVLWDMQDVMLEDVDRIEVISGPGGTLWGTNAVNGVINIVTRPAALTQGLLAVGAAGDRDSEVALRYGAAAGDTGHWRAYAKASRLEHTETASGADVPDRWNRVLAGFRADWGGARDAFMLEGNAAHGRSEFRGFRGTFPLDPIDYTSAHLLARWTRRGDDGSEIRVQGYVDHSRRDDAFLWRPREDIVDVLAQHTLPLGEHRLLWGGEYREAREDL